VRFYNLPLRYCCVGFFPRADQNMSSWVRGFTLYPAVGPVTKLSPSWGATGAYTLKGESERGADEGLHGACACRAKPASSRQVGLPLMSYLHGTHRVCIQAAK
jgi:hypothetical protein